MSTRAIEDARKHASRLKECGVGVIVLGAVILISSILIMGMAMGRLDSPWVEYMIPTPFIELVAGVCILLGLSLTLIGALVTYDAVKIEGILSRRDRR